MISLSTLPSLNAGLNATSALLLILGLIFIRQKAITAHTLCMVAAVGTSVLFLVSYLTYHYFHGVTRYPGQGVIRILYFSILISHTVLAVVNVPLVAKTLYHAFKGDFLRHVWIARMTFPVWLYVSVTGVIVYWMLYHG